MILKRKSSLIALVPPQKGQYNPKNIRDGHSVSFAIGVPDTHLAILTRESAANIREKLIIKKSINLFLRFIKIKILSDY